jgi:hypothetical protein
MTVIIDRHTRGPRLRTVSKLIPEAIARIRELGDRSLKAARNAYADEFGFEFNDKQIDRKLASLFSDALVKGRETVELPIHIVLALWLREGGAGRRVGPLSETDWSEKKFILAKVRERKRALQAAGYRAGAALETAAKEFSPGTQFSAEAIIERIRHPSGKRKKARPATGH